MTRSGAASLVYSTLVGGFVDSPSSSIVMDAAGDAYIAGQPYTTGPGAKPTDGWRYVVGTVYSCGR